MSYKTFCFESYTWDNVAKTLFCRYSLEGEIHFTEKFIFDFPWTEDIEKEALERAFEGLWIMAGISYFKTFFTS